jgi:hypothetical protein
MTTETFETIKMSWTWQAHVQSLLVLLECGNFEGKKYAESEVLKMARNLDNLLFAIDAVASDKAREEIRKIVKERG